MLKFIHDIWEKLKGILPKNGKDEISSSATQPVITQPHAAPKPPGLDCPKCGFRITISMQMLLSGEPVYCPACQLKLSVDREQSQPCLDELKKVYDAVQGVEKLKK